MKNTKAHPGACAVPHCRAPEELVWYGRPVCARHYERHCEGGAFNLFNVFGVPQPAPRPAAAEAPAGPSL